MTQSNTGRALTPLEREEMRQQADPKVRAERLRDYKRRLHARIWAETTGGEWMPGVAA